MDQLVLLFVLLLHVLPLLPVPSPNPPSTSFTNHLFLHLKLLLSSLLLSDVPFEERVFTVLQWLQLPDDQRWVILVQAINLSTPRTSLSSPSCLPVHQTRLLHPVPGGARQGGTQLRPQRYWGESKWERSRASGVLSGPTQLWCQKSGGQRRYFRGTSALLTATDFNQSSMFKTSFDGPVLKVSIYKTIISINYWYIERCILTSVE